MWAPSNVLPSSPQCGIHRHGGCLIYTGWIFHIQRCRQEEMEGQKLYTSGIQSFFKKLFKNSLTKTSSFISLARIIMWPPVAAREAGTCNFASGYILPQSKAAYITSEGENRHWVGKQKCLPQWRDVWVNSINIASIKHKGIFFNFPRNRSLLYLNFYMYLNFNLSY